MESNILDKNIPHWVENSKDLLNDFISLYEKRPVKNNKGGMLFTHMFYFYLMLKNLKPELVIESGVYKGQSTWLIESTLPNSKIISININLNSREYISKKAEYRSLDFKFNEFKNLPNNTLVFFDDHVNHLERIKQSNFFGIKNIVLEDNYTSYQGDFQTIKQISNDFNFNHKPGFFSLAKTYYKFTTIIMKKIFLSKYNSDIDLNHINQRLRDSFQNKETFNYINNLIETYYEFPPLIAYNKNDKITKKPLFNESPKNMIEYSDQLFDYNFITYIKLK